MRKIKNLIFVLFLTVFISVASAKMDLVTLPEREKVQLTIYNSADLTLARDTRTLTFKKGFNNLQFSWANTLIDPTSLEIIPLNGKNIDIMEMVFPPRVRELGIWKIDSKSPGKIPVEITYFTSGISWRAYYIATLTQDEKKMEMKGYVRVTNNSGEDYENASVRLVVGKIHILDTIASLAGKYPPFGRPGIVVDGMVMEDVSIKKEKYREAKFALAGAVSAPKEIKKEGLSEYFLYTIEGTEDLPDKWSKRLLSFKQEEIPVINLYKYEEERYGKNVMRFLYFINDKENNLGKEPLPGGLVKVFGEVDKVSHLKYIGSDDTKYIPVGEKVELNLGRAREVEVEPKLMDYKTKNYLFNNSGGNISGWDEVKTYNIKVSNYSNLLAKAEITRNFQHQYWNLKTKDKVNYEKVDLDTVKFTLILSPHSEQTFTYTVTLYEGDRRHIK